MEQRIVFDFDGVLIHSHIESMVTAYNVAAGALLENSTELPVLFEELFSRNRCHVRTAGEMTVLACWCLEAGRVSGEELNREALENLLPPNKLLRAHEERFFATRGALIAQNAERWFTLNVPFQPLWNFLQSRSSNIYIVTHKNRLAVLELCRFYQLAIPPEHVFPGDSGTSKTQNLSQLMKNFPADRYFFIDDNYRNLIELQADIDGLLPLTLLYASWGYGSQADARDAEAAGIAVHTQESVIELMRNEGL